MGQNQAPTAQPVPVTQPVVVQGTAVGQGQGPVVMTCRRCRQQFTPPPGVNDGQAQYYRCETCNAPSVRGSDLFWGSCVMS